MAMNPEVKAKWVAALRSGEYEQGKCALRKGNSFCCLGVLCDLQNKEGWHPPERGSSRYFFDDKTGLPPSYVLEWAGIGPRGGVTFGRIPQLTINGVTLDADEHNDNGASFSEIADAIEAQL